MITISQLTAFLGWATIINIAYLTLASVMLILMKETIRSIHSRMFDVDENKIGHMYFSFLSNYKVVTMAFFAAPYIALKIMGN
jgi:hypothetical protein